MLSGKTAFVSQLLPFPMEQELCINGASVIRLPRCNAIKSEVGAHPDILCCPLPSGGFIGDPVLEGVFTEFFAGDALGDGYPREVLFNCFFTERHLFASRFTDKKIVDYAASQGFEIVFVKQGYTRCSVAICGKNSYITADRGIFGALEKHGCNTLLIGGGDIKLRGFSGGFIGGCCGLADDTLVFTGNPERMSDGAEIMRFLDAVSVKVLPLSDEELYDFGGIIFV